MYQNLKEELEHAYKIAQWTPTEEQLLKIAQYIKRNPGEPHLISAYICEVCDDVLIYTSEGVDNSDLNYLIALAIKAVNETK